MQNPLSLRERVGVRVKRFDRKNLCTIHTSLDSGRKILLNADSSQ